MKHDVGSNTSKIQEFVRQSMVLEQWEEKVADSRVQLRGLAHIMEGVGIDQTSG
jgi:hypothetical protein